MTLAGAVISLGCTMLLGGCGSSSTTVNVGYDESRIVRGPLSEVTARRVVIEVTDRRTDPSIIGYKVKNGARAGVFVSSRPVREIVQEALAAELRRNGHLVVTVEADRVLRVNVREFWVDVGTVDGLWTANVSASASITLTVVNGQHRDTLLTRDYQGASTDVNAGSRDWQRVMNAALEQMMREVAIDQTLVKALREP